jgi:hypothetical protein
MPDHIPFDMGAGFTVRRVVEIIQERVQSDRRPVQDLKSEKRVSPA